MLPGAMPNPSGPYAKWRVYTRPFEAPTGPGGFQAEKRFSPEAKLMGTILGT